MDNFGDASSRIEIDVSFGFPLSGIMKQQALTRFKRYRETTLLGYSVANMPVIVPRLDLCATAEPLCMKISEADSVNHC